MTGSNTTRASRPFFFGYAFPRRLTSSPPLMAGIPSTGRPCPTASACADSFSKAPTSRTPMRDGELPEIFVLGSNCLMAKEEFGTVVATEGSLPPNRPYRPVRSNLGLNPEACREDSGQKAPPYRVWCHCAALGHCRAWQSPSPSSSSPGSTTKPRLTTWRPPT